jgi:hypothetical protein
MTERRQDAIEDFNSYRRLIERYLERMDNVEDDVTALRQEIAVMQNEQKNHDKASQKNAVVFATVISAGAGILTTLLNYLLK